MFSYPLLQLEEAIGQSSLVYHYPHSVYTFLQAFHDSGGRWRMVSSFRKPPETKLEGLMKRKFIFITTNILLAVSLLVAGCNSTAEKERKELANAEEEALEKADEANKMVPAETDTGEMAKVKEDLQNASSKLSEKQEKYLASLRQKESRLNDRLKTNAEKLKTADGNTKKRLTERHDRLTKERDQLQANILEIQSPMTDQQLETVQKEIDVLIAVIDRELNAE